MVNNNFKEGLTACEVNSYIQAVLNHSKAVACMCSYLSTADAECSLAMSKAVKDFDMASRKTYIGSRKVASRKAYMYKDGKLESLSELFFED